MGTILALALGLGLVTQWITSKPINSFLTLTLWYSTNFKSFAMMIQILNPEIG
jgi:hypothetical protein